MRDLSNISGLFGSFGNGSGTGFSLLDYKSIKNGSYGKLMKAYYRDQKTTQKTENKTTDKKQATDIDTTGINKMQTESSALKDSANKLQDSDLWKSADAEKIGKAVKSFVDEYNDVISQSSNVSNKEINRSVNTMKSMTTTMSKALDRVGITVESSGKLALNEDKLKSADTKAIKSLFDGSYTYGGQIENYASNIASAASRNSTLYTNNATLQNALGSIFSNGI